MFYTQSILRIVSYTLSQFYILSVLCAISYTPGRFHTLPVLHTVIVESDAGMRSGSDVFFLLDSFFS